MKADAVGAAQGTVTRDVGVARLECLPFGLFHGDFPLVSAFSPRAFELQLPLSFSFDPSLQLCNGLTENVFEAPPSRPKYPREPHGREGPNYPKCPR